MQRAASFSLQWGVLLPVADGGRPLQSGCPHFGCAASHKKSMRACPTISPSKDTIANTQVGEDRALSRPARVDLSALFSRPVSNVAELSLTAARPRADVAPPRPWDVEPLSTTPRRGRTHIDTQPAAAAVWGDAAEDAEMGGEGAARPETYNVWEHPGDELPTVELYPMEIR